MKRTILVSIILMIVYYLAYSEIINVNPDPDGEPWIAGGLRPLTKEDWEFLNKMPKLTIPGNYRNRVLPENLDNSLLPYFRPIFSQEGGSCGQASGIGYNFTYEIDRERQLAADIPENQYPTHYTWNFLNGGEGYGSWYWDGWQIIRSNGCPNVATYGGMAYGGHSRWITGYENYFGGMHNRVLDMFSIDVRNPEGLETLKQWMYDHLDESETGGLANFAAGVSGYLMTFLPAGTHEAGKSVIISWDPNINHAITFVGYDDSIRYDYNNDGLYTNDLDINNDSMIDMKDWEIGGLIVANSWGTGWGDEGKSYMMYKLLAESSEDGGIWNNQVHTVMTREEYTPLLTLKATIEHTSRNKIRISAGIASDISAVEPEIIQRFSLFNFQGGDHYMQGGFTEEDKTIEIGLDITPLLSGIICGEPAKIFLMIDNHDPYNIGLGEIISFSIIDYTNEEEEEVISEQQNVPIINNELTMVSVNKIFDYDVISILTDELPMAETGEYYCHQFEAINGTPPYTWSLKMDYLEFGTEDEFPIVYDTQLFPTHNDDGFAELDLEFSFPFYNELFDHVLITTDGSITFGDEFGYIRNEENLIATKAITPYGADLMIFPEQNDGMWYNCNENSVSFHWKTSRYNQPEADAEFIATLYSTGDIEFFYNSENITESPNWISGVSRGDYTSYTITNISGSSIPQDYKIHFFKPLFPYGMDISEDGLFSGIPTENDQTWDILFKVTDFNNIYSFKTLQFSTYSTGTDNNEIVLKPRLLQNYPNPFSPGSAGRSSGTSISFNLTAEDYKNADTCPPLRIIIYNIKGQKVKKLDVATRPSTEPVLSSDEGLRMTQARGNTYTVYWNGTDDSGKPVSSGIYFYKLEVDGFSTSKKMILMK
jgi:hypothetical protein